jgi:hypothetical protein
MAKNLIGGDFWLRDFDAKLPFHSVGINER